jgi:hypothetical protein
MYRVTWTIDIDAKSPKAAAKEALRIQRDPESIATHFEVAYHKTTKGKNGKTHSEYVRKEIDLLGE